MQFLYPPLAQSCIDALPAATWTCHGTHGTGLALYRHLSVLLMRRYALSVNHIWGIVEEDNFFITDLTLELKWNDTR